MTTGIDRKGVAARLGAVGGWGLTGLAVWLTVIGISREEAKGTPFAEAQVKGFFMFWRWMFFIAFPFLFGWYVLGALTIPLGWLDDPSTRTPLAAMLVHFIAYLASLVWLGRLVLATMYVVAANLGNLHVGHHRLYRLGIRLGERYGYTYARFYVLFIFAPFISYAVGELFGRAAQHAYLLVELVRHLT